MNIRLLISLLFIILSFDSSSQKLRAVLDKTDIVIGEPFHLKLQLRTQKSDSIKYEHRTQDIPVQISQGGQLSKNGGTLEITKEFVDSRTYRDSLVLWTGIYRITAWDSGEFIIPGEEIIINDSILRFNDVRLKVSLLPADKNIDLYDIREHFADVPEGKITFTSLLKSYWWVIVLLVLLSFWIIYRRRMSRKESLPEVELSLAERTLLAIDALENERLWEKDRLKEHFTELTYILRSYLASRYSISLLDKTTIQTRLLLKQQGLQDETTTLINRILSQADLVKFAKSKPNDADIFKLSAMVRQIIAETSPIKMNHV